MQILTVLGARPQFIKAAPVSKALREAGHTEFLVHTGQHYDHTLSEVFFREMTLPDPDINLGVGSGGHGEQTGRMLIGLEKVIKNQRPDLVLVYGDTNSTLAGALTAVKMHIPLAHIEAGLRSFNRRMPEEHNRVLTDHCADILLCPTRQALENLEREGIRRNAHLVGDTMLDAVGQYYDLAREKSSILETLGAASGQYYLATVHRADNTDIIANLTSIWKALMSLDLPVIFPIHPRTSRIILENGLASRFPDGASNIRLIEPLGYLDMLILIKNARTVLTDSGGMQKEACFLGVPCVTLRSETEWTETVTAGWNVCVGADYEAICHAARNRNGTGESRPGVFGDGRASEKIVAVLNQFLQK